jgi:hypothetical protein
MRAGRNLVDCVDRVGSAIGANWRPHQVEFLAVQFVGFRDGRAILSFIDRPLLFGAVELSQTILAGFRLRRSPGLDEVWNRDGRQQSHRRRDGQGHQRGGRFRRAVARPEPAFIRVLKYTEGR